ncbi:unnamed protein product [Thlaspi arvense]|uniref:Prolamin-like domain-containing protein n=1 Tax=Thlaspi arvense TaxID=13288 RepID=A0AAU9SB46_THLAR|nr:unnamed protein product [Thlaspi arvense]
MKSKQKVMFFLLTLISTLMFLPSEAQEKSDFLPSEAQEKSDLCPLSTYGILEKVPGCFNAVKLASYNDTRWLSIDCCKQVKTLPDCLFILSSDKATRTTIIINICMRKFPGSIS